MLVPKSFVALPLCFHFDACIPLFFLQDNLHVNLRFGMSQWSRPARSCLIAEPTFSSALNSAIWLYRIVALSVALPGFFRKNGEKLPSLRSYGVTLRWASNDSESEDIQVTTDFKGLVGEYGPPSQGRKNA